MMSQTGRSYRALGLIELVAHSILSGGGTSAHINIGVLGDLLVGLFGCTAGHLASLVTDIVGSIPVAVVSLTVDDVEKNRSSLDGIHCGLVD